MLSLIVGPSGYGKTESIILKIKEALEKGDERSIFVIVPEQDSVKTEALLLERCTNRINKTVEVLNFSRLANRVFREAGGMTYKYVDNAGRDIIVALLLEEIKSVTESFEKNVGDAKYIQTLRAEMDALRLRKVSPKDIERLIEKMKSEDRGGESFEKKLSDLSLLLSMYERALKEDVTDATDDITRLSETLSEFDFFENSLVFIDGFYDYTLAQYDVIERIMTSADETTVTFSLALPDREGIFRRTSNAFNTIRNIAEKNLVDLEVVTLEENHRVKNKALLALADAVMTGSDEKYSTSDGVKVTALQTPYDECVYVAREIVKIVKNGGKFSEIAVALASTDSYATVLENVFKSYDISFLNCTERSVLQTPSVVLALSALDLINSGFYINHMKTYLKNSYIGLDEEEAFLLENYITLWNIGKKQWLSPDEWTMNPRGYIEEATEEDLRELEIVNRARTKVITPLLSLYEGLREKTSVKDKAKALVEYLDRLSLFEKVSSYSSTLAESGRPDEANDEIFSWNALLSAIDMLVSFSKDKAFSRDKFIKYMRLILSDMTFGKIPSSIDEVQIGDVEFVRSRNVKHLFFIGFNEGDFPSVKSESSIFTESERGFLRENEVILEESADNKMKDQTFLFLLSLLLPELSVEFTYHTASSESKKAKALPSYFASIIEDVLGVKAVEIDLRTQPPVTREELKALLISEEADSINGEEKLTPILEECAEERAFLERGAQAMKLEDAQRFIGDKVAMTQSRFDKFSRCRYSYFLEYMLKTRTRRKAEISSLEIGSFVHKILEIVIKKIVESDMDITTVEALWIERETKLVTREYLSKIAPDLSSESPKYAYLLESVSSFALIVIDNIKNEFSSSLFRPRFFEENIATSPETKAYEVTSKDGVKMRFYGIVDRVDTFTDKDGVEYVRVVDYKSHTGGKVFSLEDVINGLNLQMLIYLFAFTGKEGKDRREAGIMYMPTIKKALSVTERIQSDEVLMDEINSNLKRSGLYLSDSDIINAMESGEEKRFMDLKKSKTGDSYAETKLSSLASLEEFGIIERYINSLFEKALSELLDGEITPNPLENEDCKSSACDWCQYHPICRFEGEARARIRSKAPMEDIKKELQ